MFPRFSKFVSKLGIIEIQPVKSEKYVIDITNQLIQRRKNNPTQVFRFLLNKN